MSILPESCTYMYNLRDTGVQHNCCQLGQQSRLFSHLPCTCSLPYSYSLFQYLAFSGLGVPKVHKLIKQLVDEHKVVPNTLLLQLPKILLKYLCRGEGGGEKTG